MDKIVVTFAALIRGLHRRRWFAIRLQQSLDRRLENFLRRNATSWDPNADEAEREKANREVKDLIKRIRTGGDRHAGRAQQRAGGEPIYAILVYKVVEDARPPAPRPEPQLLGRR
jgi:hypothetical protein